MFEQLFFRLDGDLGASVLSLEEEVFRDGSVRDPPAEASQGREHEAQEAGGGSDPGQEHAPGVLRRKL